jgi:hypothetical protein
LSALKIPSAFAPETGRDCIGMTNYPLLYKDIMMLQVLVCQGKIHSKTDVMLDTIGALLIEFSFIVYALVDAT